MSLAIGSRLGHYDVTALIGEGGMGQVCQATDTTLNRQVALKVLPQAFARDPDRLARSHSTKRCRSPHRSRMRSRPPTKPASSIGI